MFVFLIDCLSQSYESFFVELVIYCSQIYRVLIGGQLLKQHKSNHSIPRDSVQISGYNLRYECQLYSVTCYSQVTEFEERFIILVHMCTYN